MPVSYTHLDNLLVYSEETSDNVTNRPKELPADFDWNSAYGLYIQGEQWMKDVYKRQGMH